MTWGLREAIALFLGRGKRGKPKLLHYNYSAATLTTGLANLQVERSRGVLQLLVVGNAIRVFFNLVEPKEEGRKACAGS